MLSSHRTTNTVTVNYKYAVSPNHLSANKKASASVSQIIAPPLTVYKSSSVDSTVLGKSFYYEITLTNISSYPVYTYIYDYIPKCICYDSFSFTQDNLPLPYINLLNWINIGKISSNSATSLRFKAKLTTDLNIKEFSNQVYVRYYQKLSDCEPVTWHKTKSNKCIIKVNSSN